MDLNYGLRRQVHKNLFCAVKMRKMFLIEPVKYLPSCSEAPSGNVM